LNSLRATALTPEDPDRQPPSQFSTLRPLNQEPAATTAIGKLL